MTSAVSGNIVLSGSIACTANDSGDDDALAYNPVVTAQDYRGSEPPQFAHESEREVAQGLRGSGAPADPVLVISTTLVWKFSSVATSSSVSHMAQMGSR